ncbi:MAG: hypothetical protein KAS32_00815 [Candidatus Peribacteraceae bacterium]|nr:hypothetical protein [Candidatus Peribacteraceae bacterium]
MRLNDYIAEGTNGTLIQDVDLFNELIQRDCKRYLNIIAGVGEPLFRGMGNVGNLGVRDVRKDRRSRLMTSEEVKFINTWLKANGHAQRSQSVFLSPDLKHVKTFGSETYMIFPAGKIKYTWIDAKDMNFSDWNTGWHPRAVLAYRDQKKGIEPEFAHELNSLQKPFSKYFHTNINFTKAYRGGYEMWIECDKYYYADADEFTYDSKYKAII